MNRRKVLKRGVLASSIVGVPIWKTPVLNSVILPAHAQTSCAPFVSSLFRVVGRQAFSFSVSNGCVNRVTESQSSSADLYIELGHTQIKGTVDGARIYMNYSQNPVPKNHSFLPDAQSGNIPFIKPLDNFSPNTTVRLELNYFESNATLEVRVLFN